MDIVNDHAQLAFISADADTYKVTMRKGNVAGVGVSVSGAGAWAKLKGKMSFEISRLEDSQTYNEIRDKYSFGGGVSAFWSWIGVHAQGEKEHEEITKTFHEVQSSEKVSGTVEVELEVTGLYPNVQVDASAYILVLEVQDSQGNTFRVASGGDPKSDTGAKDSDGTVLPSKNNDSSIDL